MVYRNDTCQNSSYSKAKNSQSEPIEGFVTDIAINFQEKSCFGLVTYIKLQRFTTQGSSLGTWRRISFEEPIGLQFINFFITRHKWTQFSAI